MHIEEVHTSTRNVGVHKIFNNEIDNVTQTTKGKLIVM